MKTILTASVLGFAPSLADALSLVTGVSFFVLVTVLLYGSGFVLVEVRR